MKKTKKFVAVILVLLFAFVFSGCGQSADQSYKIDLEIWGLFDDSEIYTPIISKYKELNPYIGEIKYRKFSADTYRQEILDALASGQSPDIFLIQNSWLPSFENKLSPSPGLITEQEMKSNFVDVVSSDFVSNGKVFALPLSVDSIALYYNKSIFNAVGISSVPKTWPEFNEAVRKITRIDKNGNIVQSGAALGTSKNINRSSDILTLFMMQAGADMPSWKNKTARFDQGIVDSKGEVTKAGEGALNYYTTFSKLSLQQNIQNPLATWNARMHYSVDAFIEGSTAMMFNYSWQIPVIKSQNQKLDFAVAPVPQFDLDKPINYSNYWGYAVSKNKMDISPDGKSLVPMSAAKNDARVHEAWQFLKFLTMKNNGSITLVNAITKNSKSFPISYDPAVEYLKKTEKPAARRDIIELQKGDSVLGPFAYGNLIAKTWYQANPSANEEIINYAIDAVIRGESNAADALKLMTSRINSFNNSK